MIGNNINSKSFREPVDGKARTGTVRQEDDPVQSSDSGDGSYLNEAGR